MRSTIRLDRRLHSVKHLDAIEPLTAQTKDALINLEGRVVRYRPGADIAYPQDSQRTAIVLSGWACRQSILVLGRRQIFDLLVPGDIIAPHPQSWDAHCVTTALTEVVTLPAPRLASLPGLSGVLDKVRIVEEKRLLDNMARLGRTGARERVADLFCTLDDRLRVVGLAFDHRFAVPITQEVIGEALGLSTVHVNRTLRQLRDEDALELTAGWAKIPSRPRLEKIALGKDHPAKAPTRLYRGDSNQGELRSFDPPAALKTPAPPRPNERDADGVQPTLHRGRP